ncbi:two-component system sporulation sensor kinase A/two-component system, sporulation sensor kinase E [Bacillus mesophilus]|uniref:histidine kinase n=1 Tax=Bacillus mesophilus TaxID=1808955 RepID=A0A6M0Q8S4_9BACI|nr:PAS domain S-box protein [Bacillus mesophilus]MBM7661861.1 two-component system sporulation sensor kinase A/two-component system, sporulation sensor kinase E [Bacillus mesophilus]NEY72776.1 PAS domain S-box protein [Bacillus mesophilus]
MTKSYKELDLINQELYYRAFSYAPIGMALLNQSGNILKVNSSLCDFLGYKEDELLNKNVVEVSHSEDLQVDLALDSRLEDGEFSSYEMEKRYIHKSGEIIWGLLKVSKVEVSGEVFTIGQVVDITASKQAEIEKKRLKSFYDLSSEGIGIFDLEGNIIQVNKAFEKIFGYEEFEIKGRKLPVTPELSKSDAIYLIKETVEGRMVNDFETIKQRKDGRLITTSINMSPICDDLGNVAALAGMVRDITDQKEVFTLLQSFLTNNLDPILIFDAEGKLVQTNNAMVQTFGWSTRELIGLYMGELPLIPAKYTHEVDEIKKIVKDGGGIRELETIRLKKDGTLLDVLMTSFPIKDHQDLINGFAIIYRDITERKKSEELMVQSEKLSIAGQLSAAIAHEIRNPITAIKGFMNLLQNSQEKTLYYEVVNSEIGRIETILSELLNLAKPQKAVFTEADISVIVGQVITLLEAEANMNNIEIIKGFDAVLPEIVCDENQIKQVIINFIKNAMEAMPEGGKLKIDIHTENTSVLVRFSDTGCGIPKEILAKIGQPFYTTKEKGTGLGFMISKRIINDHNGTVTISSEENKGTVIEIHIPVKVA